MKDSETTNMTESTLPLTGVTKISENDIICGRGGVALKHPGNLAYRKIVGINKGIYATCLKAEKLKISKSIVAAIREIDGRFLEREDGKTSSSLNERDEHGNPVTWKDIGDKRAIEKTSQALREGQPKLLKKLAAMQNGGVAPVTKKAPPQSLTDQQQLHSSWSGKPSGDAQKPAMTKYATEPAYPNMGMQQGYAPPPDLNSSGNSGNSGSTGFQPDASLRLSALSRFSMVGDGLEGAIAGETFNAFPRNSIVERGALAGSAQSWHDSWEATPAPLPYNTNPDNNVFSSANQQHLMACLDVGDNDNVGQSNKSTQLENKRSSVKFQVEGRPSILQAKNLGYGFGDSAVSLTSHLDEMSIFDTQSLDSGMDAAEREVEMELLGEFETSDFSLNMNAPPSATLSVGSPSSGGNKRPRQSILRRNSRWTHNQNFAPAAAVTHGVDPGLIFTSTLDSKPGGINAGTDVSGLLGERRKSAVAFEVNVERRRSSRMSMMSMFSRDGGSGYLSIQSADIRDLIEMDSDSD